MTQEENNNAKEKIKQESDAAMRRQYEGCQRCTQFVIGCRDFQQCPTWLLHQNEIQRLELQKREIYGLGRS